MSSESTFDQHILQATPQDVRNSLETIFQAYPPAYSLGDTHSTSTRTRDPGAYDMHLDPALQLNTLVLTNDLPAFLATLVEARYGEMALPASLPTNALKDFQESQFPSVPLKIINEDSIKGDYPRRTALTCLNIASTILFRGNTWADLLQWFATTGTNANSGQCDGYLSIDPDKIENFPNSSAREDLRLLKKHSLLRVVLWEFKSILAGSHQIMINITRMAERGSFAWMTCNSVHFDILQSCDAPTRHSTEGHISVTGRRTGPDSTDRRLYDYLQSSGRARAAASSSTSSSLQNANNIPFELKKACSIIQQVWAELVKDDATFAVISSGNLEIILMRHRATQTLYVSNIIHPSGPNSSANPPYYKLHVGLYLAGYVDAVNRAHQLENFQTAGTIVGTSPRPMWISTYESAYDGDTTNYDLPDYLKPPKQTRQQKKEAENLRKAATKVLLEYLENIDIVKIRLNKNVLSDQRPHIFYRVQPQDEEQAELDVSEEIEDGEKSEEEEDYDPERTPRGTTVQLPEDYDESWAPEDEQESQCPTEFGSQAESQTTDYDDPVDLQIDASWTESEMWRVTSTAGRASLTRTIDGEKSAFFDGLFIKIAMNETKKKELNEEYAVYRKLSASSASCIVPVYGLFRTFNHGIGIDVLIMKYGGQSLYRLLQRGDFQTNERKAQVREEVFKAMRNLHRHGLLHNDLVSEHVLIDSPAKNYGSDRKITLCSLGSVSNLNTALPPAELLSVKRSDNEKVRLALKSSRAS